MINTVTPLRLAKVNFFLEVITEALEIEIFSEKYQFRNIQEGMISQVRFMLTLQRTSCGPLTPVSLAPLLPVETEEDSPPPP